MAKKGWPWPGYGGVGYGDSELRPKTSFWKAPISNPAVSAGRPKNLALSSEASMRFERGVDIEGVIKAADRAALLIQELAGGEIVPGWIDEYPQPLTISPITAEYP